MHVCFYCECNSASLTNFACTTIGVIVLPTNFFHIFDFDEEEDGEAQTYKEDDKEANDCFVIGYLFDLSVLE